MWTEAERRIGVGAAAAVGGLGLVYIIVGALGVLMRPPGLPLLAQVDPWLAMLEGLIILSAVALVVMMAAVREFALPPHRLHARVALAFTGAFALLTCATHFASLTVGRGLRETQPELARQLSFDWPSVNLALDLLAWDGLLGLALLFMAPVFSGGGPAGRIRWTARVAGSLCLIGLVAPLSGRMEFQLAAIAGYAFVTPLLCVMIALLFRLTPAAADPTAG